jgi:DNA-binding transcriptional MerR regulator
MADSSQTRTGADQDDTAPVKLTVGQLARMVGMSARNIRAHQARRLLPPPIRQGRAAYYHAEHVQRLQAIKALQRQGFNLVAVQAILEAGRPEPGPDPVSDRPHLALLRLGGLDPEAAVDLLVEMVGRLQPIADDVVRTAAARLRPVRRPEEPAGEATTAMTEALVVMLTEVFRGAVARSAAEVVPRIQPVAGSAAATVANGGSVTR